MLCGANPIDKGRNIGNKIARTFKWHFVKHFVVWIMIEVDGSVGDWNQVISIFRENSFWNLNVNYFIGGGFNNHLISSQLVHITKPPP